MNMSDLKEKLRQKKILVARHAKKETADAKHYFFMGEHAVPVDWKPVWHNDCCRECPCLKSMYDKFRAAAQFIRGTGSKDKFKQVRSRVYDHINKNTNVSN